MTCEWKRGSMRSLLKCKYKSKSRHISQFYSVKSDQLKMSLDYLANSDFEIAGTVLGELDMIKDIWFMSDKCQAKEV